MLEQDADAWKIAERLARVLASSYRDRGSVWLRSRVPTARRSFLVADGFGTHPGKMLIQRDPRDRSRVYLRPLVDVLAPILRRFDPSAVVRGFSYLAPGLAYSGSDTAMDLTEDVDGILGAYASTVALPTSYVGFSFGAPLYVVGLAAAVRTAASVRARSVVLIQPAFALRPNVRAAVATHRRSSPAFEQYTRPPDDDQAVYGRVRRDLAVLLRAHIPVSLIYWPGDKVLDYSDALIAPLREEGVHCREIALDFPPNITEEFAQHCYVPRHPHALREVGLCLDVMHKRRTYARGRSALERRSNASFGTKYQRR